MIKTVTDYLEQTVKVFPDKIAFADDYHGMTFNELREAALKIANRLVSMGLYRQPVAIFMDKSPECIAAFLGVAYSGNFYSPIDTKMPEARIEKIINLLQTSVVISSQKNPFIWDINKGISHLTYEDIIANEKKLKNFPKVIDSDVLYVFFTSGSTGVPKGVIIPHRAVINYIEWFTNKMNLRDVDVLGNQCPLYFDVSLQDIYGTLKVGSTTYLIPEKLFLFPIQLMQYMNEKKINVIVWVPSALCLVANLKGLRFASLPPLEKILFCGEAMPNKQLNLWRRVYPNALFVNLYGPTEACDAMAYYPVNREFGDDEPLPIGIPIDNVRVILLSEDDSPVELGEQGELCICGVALGHGYYNNFEQTQKAFVQNPLNDKYPEIIYRTGDLVHYNEYGELMYDGRKDSQIKHMGHRIELGEIETAVSSLAGVDRNCCLYDRKKEIIVLFYTGEIRDEVISLGLMELLPKYMLPNKIVKLDKMPLNRNGKIDRVSLKKRFDF